MFHIVYKKNVDVTFILNHFGKNVWFKVRSTLMALFVIKVLCVILDFVFYCL